MYFLLFIFRIGSSVFLKEKYNLVHISTGDVFRYNIKNATELGTLAKSYIDKGQLVPDSVTIDMLSATVDETPDANGFIFDGFPRTTAQAEALDKLLAEKGTEVSAMIALEVDDEILVKRLLERGKTSGKKLHLFWSRRLGPCERKREQGIVAQERPVGFKMSFPTTGSNQSFTGIFLGALRSPPTGMRNLKTRRGLARHE